MAFFYNVMHNSEAAGKEINRQTKIFYPPESTEQDSQAYSLITWALMDPYFNDYEFPPELLDELSKL